MQAQSQDFSHTLLVRSLSAAVMIPVTLGCVYLGGWAFTLLVAALGMVAVWEWQTLTLGHRKAAPLGLSMTAVGGGVVALSLVGFLAGVAVFALFSAAGAFLLGKGGGDGHWSESPLRWAFVGAIYIGVPMLALLWLRQEAGMMPVFWMLGVIWAADSGAFFAGSLIGGPKLAPRISPNKTWAGLIGALLAAGLAGAAFSVALGWPSLYLILGSVVIAAWAQLGDLFESRIKRHFQVKDTSHLIPGHGGVLDRIDSLLFSAPLVAAGAALGLGIWEGTTP